MKVIDILKENEYIVEFSGANEVYFTEPTSASVYKDCKEYCIDIQLKDKEIIYAEFWVGEDKVDVSDSEIKEMQKILNEWVEKESDSQVALSKEDY